MVVVGGKNKIALPNDEYRCLYKQRQCCCCFLLLFLLARLVFFFGYNFVVVIHENDEIYGVIQREREKKKGEKN